ncbi:MAG: hypothetical protein PVI57_14740 [Gemmatimonadota bacterium]
MRRYFATALAVAALAAVPASAQAQASFGATAAYHVDVEALGVGAVVQVPLPNLHENVNLLGDFTYYFPGDQSFGSNSVSFSYWEINGNLTYDFALEGNDSLTPFALGGLVLARSSYDAETVVGNFDLGDSTDVGLNLGGGIKLAGDLQPIIGGKLELRDGSGFVIFGSILFGGGG